MTNGPDGADGSQDRQILFRVLNIPVEFTAKGHQSFYTPCR